MTRPTSPITTPGRGVAEALPANPGAGRGPHRAAERHGGAAAQPAHQPARRPVPAIPSPSTAPGTTSTRTRSPPRPAGGGAPPTMLYTLPGPLDRIVPLAPDSPAGVVGVELSDGAPRGLEQVRSQRAEILALADSMDLAVVAGTNHHGWGRTVPAWERDAHPGVARDVAGRPRPRDRGGAAPGAPPGGHGVRAPGAISRRQRGDGRRDGARARVGVLPHADGRRAGVVGFCGRDSGR